MYNNDKFKIMKIQVDKHLMRAGDVVEVTWEARGCTDASIIMHTGNNETRIAVPEVGTKKFRLKGVTHINWIGIAGNEYGKVREQRSYIFVYGKPKTDEFTYMNGSEPWHGKVNSLWYRMKSVWGAYPVEKKRLYWILLALMLYQFIMSASPELSKILLTGIIIYIFFQIIRRN